MTNRDDEPSLERSGVLDLIEESLRELALVTVTNEIEVDLLAVEHHLRGARQMMLAALCPAGGT